MSKDKSSAGLCGILHSEHTVTVGLISLPKKWKKFGITYKKDANIDELDLSESLPNNCWNFIHSIYLLNLFLELLEKLQFELLQIIIYYLYSNN